MKNANKLFISLECGGLPMKFYKIDEISQILKVYDEDIKKCIDNGLLKPVKYTENINISQSELERFLRVCVHAYLKQENII